jgi:signal transduction histidine kinase
MKDSDIMNEFTLMTRLNIKIVCIISLFMLILMTYGQWVAFQERENEYAIQLSTITDFLIRKIPADQFTALMQEQAITERNIKKQLPSANQKLQPELEHLILVPQMIKYGFYAQDFQRIVALGPELDRSLLTGVDPALFRELFATDVPKLGVQKNSVIWYGATTLYHVRPIYANGQIVGYAFACLNLEGTRTELLSKAMQTIAVGFFILIVVIMLFQEAFIQFKRELELFAEAIVKGRARQFESKIPELTPILQYISDQTENMTRLDRLNIVGEMAASIGHEVRNPMTTVRGFLQYLSKKKEFKNAHEHFDLMISEMDRANQIISEFLSLAKNKSMDFQDRDLNQIITDIVPLLQSDALRSCCHIELDLNPIPLVRADANSMRQLILNLVRNGIEAMTHGGTLRIHTTQHKNTVLLVIQDQGSGISAEVLDKLGTPFLTTKENGIGIGLAVCYRIVHRHAGTIEVDSKTDQGTTFTIRLNCCDGVTQKDKE